MSDWQAGDLALCVKVGPWLAGKSGRVSPQQRSKPKTGRLYEVDGVTRKGGEYYLYLKGVHALGAAGGRAYYLACRFIKVTPDAETLEDRGIIEIMKKDHSHVD